jgi:hypothetical protein
MFKYGRRVKHNGMIFTLPVQSYLRYDLDRIRDQIIDINNNVIYSDYCMDSPEIYKVKHRSNKKLSEYLRENNRNFRYDRMESNRYKIISNPRNLTDREMALIVSDGELAFGFDVILDEIKIYRS